MSAPTIIPVNPQDHDAWLQQRRQGIGSSDVAPILGMSPFASAFSIWVDKVEGLPEEDSDAMRWGRRLEAAVADEFADRHPEFLVVQPTVMFAHPERPWMQANPDRLLLTGDDTPPVALLEVKTSNDSDSWDDGPPDHVQLQVQHQLAVMGLDRAWVALLMFGRQYREWEIASDGRLIEMLNRYEAEFWRRVTEKDPPPPDGSDASSDAVTWLFRDATDDELEGGQHAADLLRSRAALRAEVAEAQARLDAVENEIKVLLGEHTRLLVDGEPAASWTPVVTDRLDTKALEAEHPELAKRYRRTATYRRFTVKKGWK